MLTVLKLGGSVLSDAAGYRRAAHFVADRVASDPAGSWLVVASAAFGETDGLLASARAIAAEPDAATLDLLWSTGEVRSAAIVALHLQARGLRACALNVHQAGLVEDGDRRPGHAAVRSLAVRAALAVHDVVVVPGFLARAAGDAVVSLGRGGSESDGRAACLGARSPPLRAGQGRARLLLVGPPYPPGRAADSRAGFRERTRDGGWRVRPRTAPRPRSRRPPLPAARRSIGRRRGSHPYQLICSV